MFISFDVVLQALVALDIERCRPSAVRVETVAR